jgi:hypothetical protein
VNRGGDDSTFLDVQACNWKGGCGGSSKLKGLELALERVQAYSWRDTSLQFGG